MTRYRGGGGWHEKSEGTQTHPFTQAAHSHVIHDAVWSSKEDIPRRVPFLGHTGPPAMRSCVCISFAATAPFSLELSGMLSDKEQPDIADSMPVT